MVEESYPRTGPGVPKPVLVLGHGLTSSLSLNDRQKFPDWTRLRDHYPLVRFDARGHGQSSPCHDPLGYTWESLGLDLVGLIERLELEDIVLGGSSMGAASSLYALVDRSPLASKVRGLVLVMPPTFGEARETISKVYGKFASILEEKDQSALTSSFRSLPGTPFLEREYPQGREIGFQDFEQNTDRLSMAAAFRGAALSRYPEPERIASIKVPTIILSRIDDPSHPVQSAELLNSLIKGSIHFVARNKDDVLQWPVLVRKFVDKVVQVG